jgi:hypothetical protein
MFFPDYTNQVLDPLSNFQQASGHPPVFSVVQFSF